MRKPYVGAVVLMRYDQYPVGLNFTEDVDMPALVCRLADGFHPEGAVNLAAFEPGGSHWGGEYAVPYSEAPKHRTWRWPKDPTP